MRTEIERARAGYEEELKALISNRDKRLEEADKKALGIVENADRAAKSLIKTIEATARSSADRKLERTKKHFEKIKEQAEHRDEERLTHRYEPDERPLEEGDNVVIAGTATVGILGEIRKDKAIVVSGAARMELPVKMLRRATGAENKANKRNERTYRKSGITMTSDGGVTVKITPPPSPVGVPSSIMIRGMTIDEAMPIAERYIDRAYRAGYGEVSVIHGRGEGILRREVQNLCRNLPYVDSYRLGGTGEGGFGVTIVRFKK
jgi:DNA mismatch repair protein MutS2